MTITSGKVKVKNYWITIGQYKHEGELKTGVADIIGQMKDGRMLAIEVKLPGNEPTSEQVYFLDVINGNYGLSGIAHSVNDAIIILENK